MPMGNGTGPAGKGPGTGRGLGSCADAGASGKWLAAAGAVLGIVSLLAKLLSSKKKTGADERNRIRK